MKYTDNKDLLRAHYHVKVVLNGPIDPRINCTELILTDLVRSEKEMKFVSKNLEMFLITLNLVLLFNVQVLMIEEDYINVHPHSYLF
jgi:hypothetical protein